LHCFYLLIAVNFSLTTELPWWLVFFCLLAGTGISAILYLKDKNSEYNLLTKRILAVIRGFAVFLIAFLLLSPMIKTISRRLEKPVVIMALDNSESILTGKDSAYYRGEFIGQLNKLADNLSGKYELQTYDYSDKLQPGITNDFQGKQTDMGQLFDEIGTRYTNRNIAAIIIAGDGLVNRGADPLYASENIAYPIVTVALGDTNQHRDVLISRVVYNQLAYMGNDFPLEITLSAYQCEGQSVTLNVTDEKSARLFTQPVSVTSAEFTRTIQIKIQASEAGTRRYRISVSGVNGEVSQSNNVRDIFVDVIDGRQKILIMSASPHPDIAALRQAIEINPNYQVVQLTATDDPGDLHQYDLAILHQLPSMANAAVALLEKIRNAKIPALFIVGKQSNLAAFNQLKTGLSIIATSTSSNEAYASVNDNFPLFSLPEEVKNMIANMPPLSVPFGQFQQATASEVLMNQRIGSVATQMPLVMFNQGFETKTGIVAGEGLWRWRISCYMKSGNHKAFDELVSKIIQYLAVKEDKSRFRIIDKKSYLENEQVTFDAELYNGSYELDNTPEVKLVVTDSVNKSYPFVFSRTSNAYTLNAGSFAPGRYNYEASVVYDNKPMQKRGTFTVIPINVETLNTVANHSLMFNLASRHGGIMVYPAQLNEIEKFLSEREDIKTVAYSQKRFTDLVNQWWVLALIIGLLTTEWFLRKRGGGY